MKTAVRVAVDAAVVAGLILLMCYGAVGGAAHEYLGIAFFIVLVVHNLLNLRFYRALLHGHVGLARIVRLAVALLCLLLAIGLCVDSLALVRYSPLAISLPLGTLDVIRLHNGLSCWMLVFMGVHFGQCLQARASRAMRRSRRPRATAGVCALAASAVCIAAIVLFPRVGFASHLAFRSTNVSLGGGMSQAGLAAALLCLFGLFAVAGFFLQRLLARLSVRRKPGDGQLSCAAIDSEGSRK